ncbi:K+/H+ antiporter subunit F [Donghicola tyrosinivorans]|uniref:Multicomponent K+:H+ antiporter subunit F n=1 Tax=Donghicola tyrosinivorans TaxID=1652492 RepID=A0A2T0WYA3_9RHOB|nr:K+/H+ antiporter subunit F [Donghicola tyrosinivorans]PRY91678.1 multicomponent K+:H+ antiporter subunit F [Donghicola tyrosinivorans]
MIDYALDFAFICFGLGLLFTLYRVIFAPGVGDRVLALDTMVINTIAILVLQGINQGTEIFFEAAMVVAMLGFVGTVAYARFMLRGNIIE